MRRIQLNWHRLDSDGQQNSWIGLYDHQPTRFNYYYTYLERHYPASISGKHTTGKAYEQFSFQSGFSGDKRKRHLADFLESRNDSALNELLSTSIWSGCVKYWIAYIRHGKRLVAKRCLSTHPQWMEDSMSIIGNRSMLELALPGTHNSGSYEMRTLMSNFPYIDKYTYCQDESIWNQLIYGVRFFDIRLAFDASKSDERRQVAVAHGVMRLPVLLVDVLEQILAFTLSTRQEVLVLDFHRFEKGFEESIDFMELVRRHTVVERLIIDYLGPYLLPVDTGIEKPIRELAATNRRIIVGYNWHGRNSKYFHTKALHVWAKEDNKDFLFRYLNERSCRSTAPYVVSLMAELTPSFFGLMTNKYRGLRGLAERVNHDLSVAISEEWWQCMNVVASDYFLGNNVIELAIEANIQREQRKLIPGASPPSFADTSAG